MVCSFSLSLSLSFANVPITGNTIYGDLDTVNAQSNSTVIANVADAAEAAAAAETSFQRQMSFLC